MTQLPADAPASAAALRGTWSAMRAADWDRDMPHHRYGALPLSDSPMMRLGEVEIHHVDLAGHFGPDGWPDSFVAHILAAASHLSGRLPGGLALDVRATDTGERWSAGPGARGGAAGAAGTASAGSGADAGGTASAGSSAGAGGGTGPHAGAVRTVAVAGPSWAIAAWLVGRPGPAAGALSVTGGELPQLSPWP
jgi:hypothetical protein